MPYNLLLLVALGAVFRAALLAVCRTCRIARSANDVIADAGEIADATTAHEDDRVLLEVVADAGDVRRHLFAVGEANASDLTQRRVGLLRGDRLHLRANAAPLRVPGDLEGARRKIGMTRLGPRERHAKRARLDLLLGLRSSTTDQLVDCRHYFSLRAADSVTHKFGRTCRWA